MKLARRTFILLSMAIAYPAYAHHGWRWTGDGDFELTGVITDAKLGNPHGVLTIDAEGETWQVEVGQPYRNIAAGLTDEMLAVGTEVTILGQRSADPEQKLMKAERVTIAGQNYDLYPDRL